MQQEFYKITQVAKMLGVTKMCLYKWKKKGLITFVKPYENNDHNCVTKEELERLLSVNNIH